jgi:hypothetical protein
MEGRRIYHYGDEPGSCHRAAGLLLTIVAQTVSTDLLNTAILVRCRLLGIVGYSRAESDRPSVGGDRVGGRG